MEHAPSAARPAAPLRFPLGGTGPDSTPGFAPGTEPLPGHPAVAALGYAGDVAPGLAWQLVQSGQALLVDVRTTEELHWVGRVPGALHIEWARGRDQIPNERFLEQLAGAVPRDRQVLFLCRSGVRSVSAAKAATRAGYASAWNILQGFEGPLDSQKQRGRIGGWRAAGLPWQQS